MVIKSSIRLVGNVAGMTEVIMHTKWSLGRPRHRRKDVDSIRLAQQWNKQAVLKTVMNLRIPLHGCGLLD